MKVALWNPAAERIFGWKADEILGGEVPDEIIPESERASWAARVQRTLAGSVTNGDRVQRQTKDGRLRWVDVYAAPLRDPLGKPIGITAQLVDVSDRVELEAQLLQAQKMEAIGPLAGGIAHDFNNILTAAGLLDAVRRAQCHRRRDPHGSPRRSSRRRPRAPAHSASSWRSGDIGSRVPLSDARSDRSGLRRSNPCSASSSAAEEGDGIEVPDCATGDDPGGRRCTCSSRR